MVFGWIGFSAQIQPDSILEAKSVQILEELGFVVFGQHGNSGSCGIALRCVLFEDGLRNIEAEPKHNADAACGFDSVHGPRQRARRSLLGDCLEAADGAIHTRSVHVPGNNDRIMNGADLLENFFGLLAPSLWGGTVLEMGRDDREAPLG